MTCPWKSRWVKPKPSPRSLAAKSTQMALTSWTNKLQEGTSTSTTQFRDPSGRPVLDAISTTPILSINRATTTPPSPPSTTTLTILADAPAATTANIEKLRQKHFATGQKPPSCPPWLTRTSSRSAMIDATGTVIVEEETSAGAMVSLRHSTLEASKILICTDDNDNYSRDRGRGPQRRRHDDAPPRRRYEEPPFPKLRRLLLNIASSTKLPQDEAIEIAKLFGENFDDERLRSDFFDVWVQL